MPLRVPVLASIARLGSGGGPSLGLTVSDTVLDWAPL